MHAAEFVFQYQLCVDFLLPVAVAGGAEGAVEGVDVAVGEQGKVGVVLAVDEEGVFHVGF